MVMTPTVTVNTPVDTLHWGFVPNCAKAIGEKMNAHEHDVAQGTVVVRVTTEVTPGMLTTLSCKGITNEPPSAASVAVNWARVQAVRPVIELVVSAP